MYKAHIHITLRKSILDPKGKASLHALQSLGYSGIQSVRIGKFVEVDIQASSIEEARKMATEASEKLLANPIMEDFTVDVVEVK